MIGVAGPITGPNAAFGAQLKNGAEQAVADINAAGGINGEKIKLVVGDDVSDPKQGVSVANKFVGDGVKFVVGHFNSGVSIPASEVYAENGILEITPAATNPKFTERGLWNTFRTCGRDDQQGGVAGNYHRRQVQGREDRRRPRQDDLRPGPRRRDQEGDERRRRQGSPLRRRQRRRQGLLGAVAKMKEAGVDVVYWGGLHTEAGLIIRQMGDQGLKAPLMSGDGIVSDEFASIAGAAVDGTLMTFGPDPRKNPAAKELVEKFRAQGFEPEAYTLYTYAAMQVDRRGGQGGRRRPTARRSPRRMQVGQGSVQDRDRRHLLRREGRHHAVRTTSCTSGRRAPTASSPTFQKM